MDLKLPRPGLRARLIWIGVFCGLVGGLAGRFSARPPRDRPPSARLPDSEGDRLLNQALLASSIRDSLRQRATESPATQRRADEAATRTYADMKLSLGERRPPSRRPAPPRPLPFTPAPTPTPTPAPPRPLLFTPAPPRPLPFTPAPPPTLAPAPAG